MTRGGVKLRETSDDYPRVVARLSERWRMIVCRDGLQWIVQHRDAGKAPSTGWRAMGYYLTRAALLRLCVGAEPRIDPEVMALLLALPERIARAAQSAPPASTVEPRLGFSGIERPGEEGGTLRGARARLEGDEV